MCTRKLRHQLHLALISFGVRNQTKTIRRITTHARSMNSMTTRKMRMSEQMLQISACSPNLGTSSHSEVAIWVFCNAAESKPWIPKRPRTLVSSASALQSHKVDERPSRTKRQSTHQATKTPARTQSSMSRMTSMSSKKIDACSISSPLKSKTRHTWVP